MKTERTIGFLKSAALLWAAFVFVVAMGLGARADDAPYGEKEAKVVKGEEVLVARNIVINGIPIWCTSDALLYLSEGSGIYWHDVETGRKVQVTEWVAFPVGCTSDGKWAIYTEFLYTDGDDVTASDVTERVFWDSEDILGYFESLNFGFGERTLTGVWRYEIATGRRERIGVKFADESMGVAFDESSPGGVKVFFGREPDTKIEMPDPKWKVIWSKRRESTTASEWLPDFSAHVNFRWDEALDRGVIDVEVYSPRREIFTLFHEAGSVPLLFVDGKGRLYVKVIDDLNTFVERCSIDMDKRAMSCGRALDVKWRPGEENALACPGCSAVLPAISFMNYHFFTDDDAVLFVSEDDGCVKLWNFKKKEAACITGHGYDIDKLVKVSPDERRVAFNVTRGQESPLGWQNSVDIYVAKIKRAGSL